MPRRVVETPPAESDWIWGSGRGGGGAPLRDPSGHTVANLRAVVRGDVEVDNSPADSPKRRGGREDEYSKKFRSRGVDDDYDFEDEAAPRRRGRKSVGYVDENDYDDEIPINREHRRRGGGGGGLNRSSGGVASRRRGGDDYEEYEQDLGGYDDYEARRDRGKDRDRNRARSPMSTLDRQSKGGAPPNASPKKYMNSLKDMNTSASKVEQDARMRKDLNHQNQLREQIEEKRRKKEEEERKAEETKKKELEEYLAVHYKGKIPAYVLDKLPNRGKMLGSGKREGSLSLDNDESIYNVGRKAASFDDDYGDAPPRHRDHGSKGKHGSGEKPPRRAQFDDDNDLHLELDDIDGGARDKAPPRRRRLRNADDPPGDKWVSQNEYDELSALCDKLLVQQDTLQSELRNQAKLLKVSVFFHARSRPPYRPVLAQVSQHLCF